MFLLRIDVPQDKGDSNYNVCIGPIGSVEMNNIFDALSIAHHDFAATF